LLTFIIIHRIHSLSGLKLHSKFILKDGDLFNQ